MALCAGCQASSRQRRMPGCCRRSLYEELHTASVCLRRADSCSLLFPPCCVHLARNTATTLLEYPRKCCHTAPELRYGRGGAAVSASLFLSCSRQAYGLLVVCYWQVVKRAQRLCVKGNMEAAPTPPRKTGPWDAEEDARLVLAVGCCTHPLCSAPFSSTWAAHTPLASALSMLPGGRLRQHQSISQDERRV